MADGFSSRNLSAGRRRAMALVSLGRFAQGMARIDQALRLRDLVRPLYVPQADEKDDCGAGVSAPTVAYVHALQNLLSDTIRQLGTDWLLHYPAGLDHPSFAEVRLSLHDVETRPRAEFLAEVVRQMLALAPHKAEIDRLDALLEAIGLAGASDPGLRRDLVELSHVERIMARRDGVVDQHLRRACPWVRLGIGQDLEPSAGDCRRYGDAVKRYMLTVVARTRASQAA